MKNLTKLFMVFVLLFSSAVTLFSYPTGSQAREVVELDGAELVGNRTLVPLRAIFEELGAVVDWNQAAKSVTAYKGSQRVFLTIGSRHTTVNGEHVVIDVPAQVSDGRTLVPLRFVSEALGADVQWNGQSATATITSAEKVIHVKVGKTSRYEEQALNLVKRHFDYDPSVNYRVELLHGTQFYLIEARVDFGSGIPSLVDAFIIVPSIYSDNPVIQNQLYEEDFDDFWYTVQILRSGIFG
ncbi:copper amine oxidase N-terminal domain-containing protein [Paenalkalicoccus suaedae]|uniref:Copper amine oxidase N-terminal domain-containing protein n=1 Tax=Paenalkalicoccus suaedae TaxID=2592382 RepID=A0A859FGV1_9BACI|nr:copper amine oxidase N-terminal domain-containing protein [Paenalkalicoccus suaedae]QKS72347.1 copper amine oxidase N-terminal domain-containing protein [Paenalkalicoccus suaedae]